MKTELNKLKREELAVIARKLNVIGASKKNKSDLLKQIQKPENRKKLNAILNETFLQLYHNHIYGILTVLALVLAIYFWYFPREVVKDLEPIEKAMCRDMRILFQEYDRIFRKMYEDSYPYHDTLSINKFYSDNGLMKCWKYLDIECNPRVNPFESYDDYLRTNLRITQKNTIDFLSLYKEYLAPEIFNQLHSLGKSYQIEVLAAIPKYKSFLKSNIPQLQTSLNSFGVKLTTREFEAMIFIYNYYNDRVIKIGDERLSSIVYDSIFIPNHSCTLSDDLIKKDTFNVPFRANEFE